MNEIIIVGPQPAKRKLTLEEAAAKRRARLEKQAKRKGKIINSIECVIYLARARRCVFIARKGAIPAAFVANYPAIELDRIITNGEVYEFLD